MTTPKTQDNAGADAAAFAGHTPGPWECVEAHPTLSLVNDHVTDSRGNWITVVCYNRTGQTVGGIPMPGNEWMANARLIAAAPSLLAEVQSLRAKLAASEASRAELIGALENALDFIREEHGEGPTARTCERAISNARTLTEGSAK